MRAAEPSIHSQSAEMDGFLLLAMRELKAAVRNVSAYAALLDAQMAEQPDTTPLREIVRDVRGQAELVVALVDSVLD
jgi:light-regulated signal transduction histidine kinase (bacteriophytochrome)